MDNRAIIRGCLSHITHPCEGCGRRAGGLYDEPKSCMRCGSKAETLQYGIRCSNDACPESMCWVSEVMWNHRPREDALCKEIERLRTVADIWEKGCKSMESVVDAIGRYRMGCIMRCEKTKQKALDKALNAYEAIGTNKQRCFKNE